MVTRDWIIENIEPDFTQKFFKSEREKGFVFFSNDGFLTKTIQDDETLKTIIEAKGIEPLYIHKKAIDDDKIHCIRVGVDFEEPYTQCIPVSFKWAIMTERQTLTKGDHSKKNPWNTKDKDGETRHIYHDCNANLLLQALGETFYSLILSSIEATYTYEFQHQGTAYREPTFIFGGNPHVSFQSDKSRYIDKYDYGNTFGRNKKSSIFSQQFCGVISGQQYYYFDLCQLETEYYVNVSTKQICGICWNIVQQQFIDLEKYKEKGIQ